MSDRRSPVVEELVPAPNPIECCERIEHLPYRLFLDSASTATRLGRYSFLMADPIAVIRSKGKRNDVLDCMTAAGHLVSGDIFDIVRARLSAHETEPVAGLPPFQGGVAGYIGYDWGLTLERLPAPRYDDLALPDLLLGVYDWVLAWDHVAARAWMISTGMPETNADARLLRARERASMVLGWLRGDSRQTAPGQKARPTLSVAEGGAPSYVVENGWWQSRVDLRSSFTRNAYLEAVQRVRDYILAGDIFQANLSQRFDAPLRDICPWEFYRRLRSRNPAPFAAFLDSPDAVIISASPERFMHVDTTRQVETRPIKGTRPRGVGPEHDAALGQALAESAKDRAENLMIVDLMRNDLSRVCRPGSVRVSELFSLERYATVHHLVSTVVGQLEPGLDALHLLRAAFPGGSITGAPKLRAMEVIAELEPSQRGVYCGSIGYWSVTGELDTSIAIRTAVMGPGGRVYFSAGGGIVADSDPEQEYQETLDKARALIDALPPEG
ncbi:MAG TPA: aminodeoxychorismate synthase component I [Vicinamibacterales bacterium]|nr:aminodeoxychorismate synthase component I [Vicinamibacterales bacterium]